MPPNPANFNDSAEPLTGEGCLVRRSAGPSTVAFYRNELTRFKRKLRALLAMAPTKGLERLKAELRDTESGRTRCRLLPQFSMAARQNDRPDIFRLERKDGRISPADILTLPEVRAMLQAARG